ncbi:hypothetical protein AAC387_Pa01g2009 [Persea americana]
MEREGTRAEQLDSGRMETGEQQPGSGRMETGLMKTYKGYVKNMAHPEGCIAERYVIEESILYCMEYMPDGDRGSHKRTHQRFLDDDGVLMAEQGTNYLNAGSSMLPKQRMIKSSSADDVLNPKKKVREMLQPDLHTNTELVACYKDVPFTTTAGVCNVSSISSGSIR